MTYEQNIDRTRDFVRQAFIDNPHYSFGHWSVMYDHSVTVETIARKIVKRIGGNEELVALGALLHDIGKTYKADAETLHYKHEEFNLPVSEKFIDSLELVQKEIILLKKIVSLDESLAEMMIIKDADALALWADKRLYMLYIAWAVENDLKDSILRKINKYDKLHHEYSRVIGKKWLDTMMIDWEGYMSERAYKI